MDAEAIRQLETRNPDKISENWDDAAQRCNNSDAPLATYWIRTLADAARPRTIAALGPWCQLLSCRLLGRLYVVPGAAPSRAFNLP